MIGNILQPDFGDHMDGMETSSPQHRQVLSEVVTQLDPEVEYSYISVHLALLQSHIVLLKQADGKRAFKQLLTGMFQKVNGLSPTISIDDILPIEEITTSVFDNIDEQGFDTHVDNLLQDPDSNLARFMFYSFSKVRVSIDQENEPLSRISPQRMFMYYNLYVGNIEDFDDGPFVNLLSAERYVQRLCDQEYIGGFAQPLAMSLSYYIRLAYGDISEVVCNTGDYIPQSQIVDGVDKYIAKSYFFVSEETHQNRVNQIAEVVSGLFNKDITEFERFFFKYLPDWLLEAESSLHEG